MEPEIAVPGHARAEHVVQLFDDEGSLSQAVAAFLLDGLQQEETLLVVATARHWEAIAERLEASGRSVSDLTASGRLTIRDACKTLDLFIRHDRPDANLFEDTVGALVRSLRGRGRPLRIYGEMVDVLATEGSYRSAQQLEELWNGLGEREPFMLFCGYSAANFGDPRTGEALRGICRVHSRVQCAPHDMLGWFVLHTHAGGAIAATTT